MKNECSNREFLLEIQKGRLTLALLEFLIEPGPVTDLREKDEDTVL